MKSKFIYVCALIATLFAMSGTEAKATETWEPMGTGWLRDDILTSIYVTSTYYEFQVEVEQCKEVPGRYRLVNAYANCPSVGGDPFPADATNYLVIDASDPQHVYVEQGGTSYYCGWGQQLCLWSIADDYYNNLYGDWTQADEEGVCGKMVDGIITFPRGALLYVPVEEDVFHPEDHDFHWVQSNKNGMFRLLLPGVPKHDIDITVMGLADTQDAVNYYLNLDEDIEYAQAAVFEGEYNASMTERIKKTVNGTATDDEKVELQKITKSGIHSFPYDKDGIHTLVVVPYANEKAWPESKLTAEWAYSESEWKNVGKATYVEAIVSSNELTAYGFAIDPYTYDVPVQQNVSSPWLIRLVDPYGPDCYPMASSTNYDSSRHHYVNFDLGDFNNCSVLYTEDLGITLGNVGRISVWSYVDRARNGQLSQEFVDEYYPDGLPTGKFDPNTNKLTFDRRAINILYGANPSAWYAANLNGTFSLKLGSDVVVTPNPGTGVSGVEVSDKTVTPEYFTLSGTRVNGKPNAGVYIERRGDKVRKVMLK